MTPFLTPSHDPAQSAFEAVISLLKHEWIRRFLFPTDSSSYPDQLRYALLQPSVAQGVLNLSMHPTNGADDDKYACDERMHMVFAPSYSSGPHTAGFQILERCRTANPLYKGIPRYVARTVRDDENGLFLTVREHAVGLTELHCTSQMSPGSRTKAYTLVRSRPFRGILARLEHGFDFESFRGALLQRFFSVEMRACPSCGSHTATMCSCSTPIKKKLHPLDHATELRNVSAYAGAYEGFGVLRMYEQGDDTYFGNFASKCSAYAFPNGDLQRLLTIWAMQDAVQDSTVNLLKLTMTDATRYMNGTGVCRWSETDNGEEGKTGNVFDTDAGKSYLQRWLSSSSSTKFGPLREAETEILSLKDMTTPNPKESGQSGSDAEFDNAKSIIPMPHSAAVGVVTPVRCRPLLPASTMDVVLAEREREGRRKEEAEARKAEARRARNREFARRSNERKRLHLQGLRNGIAEASRKAENLRQREMLLRKENEALKVALDRRALNRRTLLG